jgi:hypothetical protein
MRKHILSVLSNVEVERLRKERGRREMPFVGGAKDMLLRRSRFVGGSARRYVKSAGWHEDSSRVRADLV